MDARSDEKAQQALEAYSALARAHRRIRRILKAYLQPHGLTPGQYAMLQRIPPEGASLTALAEKAWVDPANASRIIERLRQEGHIVQERAGYDRRVIEIRRTPTGDALARSVEAGYRRRLAEAMQGLTEDELITLRFLAERLIAGEPAEPLP